MTVMERGGRSHALVRIHRLSIPLASARWRDPTELRLKSWRATGNETMASVRGGVRYRRGLRFYRGLYQRRVIERAGRARGYGQAGERRRAGPAGCGRHGERGAERRLADDRLTRRRVRHAGAR